MVCDNVIAAYIIRCAIRRQDAVVAVLSLGRVKVGAIAPTPIVLGNEQTDLVD
jgi:hypothetical protein